jgi:hypothetical protein
MDWKPRKHMFGTNPRTVKRIGVKGGSKGKRFSPLRWGVAAMTAVVVLLWWLVQLLLVLRHGPHVPMSPTAATTTLRGTGSRAQVDGRFNGAPLRLQHLSSPTAASRVHCVGDNYLSPNSSGTSAAWQQRSCHFTFLCFNTTARRFVVFQSEAEQDLTKVVQHQDFFRVSNLMAAGPHEQWQTVSIGGINQKWGHEGIARLEWFPDVINVETKASTTTPLAYYALPSSVVWLPYHSLNGANPGHAVWDDFMSLYTLLDIFDLLDDREPLLMRYILQDGLRGQWASCDFRPDKTEDCAHILNKFSPLMMGTTNGYHWSTNEDFRFQPQADASVDLVCAAHGAAGIGSLTDHGVSKSHGWLAEDYQTTHNHGRGGLMRRFRAYALANIGLEDHRVVPRAGPHQVVFSQNSSSVPVRMLNFEFEVQVLQKALPHAVVQSTVLKKLSLYEQMELASRTAVLVTFCGGGAVTGMFLPKGASLIIYYQHNGGIRNGKPTGDLAMLDWDLFSAMSHIRVHWIPLSLRGNPVGQAGLVFLIQHELLLIDSQSFD